MLWFQLPLGLKIEALVDKDMDAWLKDVIYEQPLELVEMLATLAHDVCLARNKLTFEGKLTESKLVIGRAMSILHMY